MKVSFCRSTAGPPTNCIEMPGYVDAWLKPRLSLGVTDCTGCTEGRPCK